MKTFVIICAAFLFAATAQAGTVYLPPGGDYCENNVEWLNYFGSVDNYNQFANDTDTDAVVGTYSVSAESTSFGDVGAYALWDQNGLYWFGMTAFPGPKIDASGYDTMRVYIKQERATDNVKIEIGEGRWGDKTIITIDKAGTFGWTEFVIPISGLVDGNTFTCGGATATVTVDPDPCDLTSIRKVAIYSQGAAATGKILIDGLTFAKGPVSADEIYQILEAKLDAPIEINLEPIEVKLDVLEARADNATAIDALEIKLDQLALDVAALETKLDIIEKLLRTPQGRRADWNE